MRTVIIGIIYKGQNKRTSFGNVLLFLLKNLENIKRDNIIKYDTPS